jgi:hypothetical protein
MSSTGRPISTARHVAYRRLKYGTKTLVPQLDSLRKQVMTAGAVRTIRLRGKCALSTGVAIGATFPAVGGWTFEIPQPPAKEHWISDAMSTPGYLLQVEIIEGAADGG